MGSCNAAILIYFVDSSIKSEDFIPLLTVVVQLHAYIELPQFLDRRQFALCLSTGIAVLVATNII